MRCAPQPNQSDAASEHLMFPPEGSAEYEHFLSMARDGKIVFGANSAGEEAIWHLQDEPHALIAGVAGSGKSAAVTLPIFAALCCPHVFDLIVVDRTGEFAWTAQFPNVRHITDMDEASVCIEQLRSELSDRHALLQRRGGPNLRILREMYTRNPELAAQDGPASKRLMVVLNDFDERGLTECAQADLLRIAQLSRAVEINFLVTAQRPTGGVMSPHFRKELGFRLWLGAIDRDTSRGVFFTDAAAEATAQDVLGPRGRAWMGSYRAPVRFPAVWVPYLPMKTQPSPWETSVELEGAEERALHHQATHVDARGASRNIAGEANF